MDDIGYVKQAPEEAEVLFTLIAERYERRSMLSASASKLSLKATIGQRQPLKLSVSSKSRWSKDAPAIVTPSSSQLVKSYAASRPGGCSWGK